jgi:integrase
MGRKSQHGLPPGIQLDQNGFYWATLEGEDAKLWRERYPGRSLPRRRARDIKTAIKLQRSLTDDLKVNRDPNAENPEVADWVKTCIERKRKLALSTVVRYKGLLTWQIEPHLIGRLRLRQVQRRQLEEWIDTLIKQKHHRHEDRTLDPYTIRNAFALMRMAFNMAIADGLLVTNPCKGVELPRPDDEEIHPLTPKQVNVLMATLQNHIAGKNGRTNQPHRLLALYHVAIRCGLRQGELFGLRWKDVDFQRRELRVDGQIRQGRRTRGKTKHAHRTVPLSSETIRVLKWHKENQEQEKQISPEGWNADDLMFCSERGTPLDPSSIGDQFDALLRKAGLPDIRFHDMRHTYAALSIAAGVDIYTLSRRMGHSTIAVTADRYGHLYKGHAQDVDAIDRLLKERKK